MYTFLVNTCTRGWLVLPFSILQLIYLAIFWGSKGWKLLQWRLWFCRAVDLLFSCVVSLVLLSSWFVLQRVFLLLGGWCARWSKSVKGCYSHKMHKTFPLFSTQKKKKGEKRKRSSPHLFFFSFFFILLFYSDQIHRMMAIVKGGWCFGEMVKALFGQINYCNLSNLIQFWRCFCRADQFFPNMIWPFFSCTLSFLASPFVFGDDWC